MSHAVNQSIFIAEDHNSFSLAADASSNSTDGELFVQYGSGSGKFPLASLPRMCTCNSWHLGDPNTGDPIPKLAVIDRVSVEIVPDRNHSYTGLEATTRLALMAADGHWDRSRTSSLHLRVQEIDDNPVESPWITGYSSAVQSATVELYVDNASEQIAETVTDNSQYSDLVTHTAFVYQTYGNNVLIPAGEEIHAIRMPLGRFDNPLGDAGMQLQLYSLNRNHRDGVPEQKGPISDTIMYRSMTQGSTTEQTFTFSPPVPAQSEDRYIGVLLEGPIFNPILATTQTVRVIFRHFRRLLQETYALGGTASMLYATTSVEHSRWENSFHGFYVDGVQAPVLYKNASQQPLELPFPRYTGNIMGWDGVEPLVFTNNVPIAFGSDPADEPLTGDIVAEMQAWIDGADYDPDTGRYWVGMFMDQLGPKAARYVHYHTPVSDNTAIKLTLDWHVVPRGAIADGRLLQRVAARSSRARSRVEVEARSVRRVRSSGSRAHARVSLDVGSSHRISSPGAVSSERVSAEAMSTERVHAPAARSRPRVSSETNESERIFAGHQALLRVKPTNVKGGGRVSAPLSRLRTQS